MSSLALFIVLAHGVVSVGQAGERLPNPTEAKATVDQDGEQTIEKLASKNTPPVFRKERKLPVFDASYDVDDDQRVWQQLRGLARNCDALLPSLVKHFDDGRYCTTVSTPSGAIRILTVGDVCYELVANAIAEGYVRHVVSQSKQVLGQIRNSNVSGKKRLKDWYRERDGQPLFVLQGELCDWAIGRLKSGEVTMVSRETAQEWIAKIEEQKVSFARTKKSVDPSWFQGEQFTPVRPSQKEKK